MIELDTYIPKSFMAIMAHPDDIEFSCSGTVAKWLQAGARGKYVLVTSGDVGIATDGMTKAKAAEIREAETLAAAKTVGITDVTFLRVPDGMVENNMELRRRLVREIRLFQPELVFTGDPTLLFTPTGGINHPDHRAVGGATIDAIFPAVGQPNLFQEFEEEGIYAHKVRKIYISSRGSGDAIVDIGSTIHLKIQALKDHDSQLGSWADLEERMRERCKQIAEDCEAEYAERFRIVTVESDETWARLQKEKPEQYTR